jgi:DNA-binding IclR family transcriptional regulator
MSGDSMLARGLAILELLACSPSPQSFGAINRALGAISRATQSRLLKSLQTEGFVVRDPVTGLYRCGGRMGVFGALRVRGRGPWLLHKCEPLMQRLVADYSISAILLERIGNVLVCIRRVTTESSAAMQPEGRINREMDQPWGLLLAAHDPDVAAGIQRPELTERYGRIRELGYCYDDQTLRRNFRRIGFPILDEAGVLLGCLGLGGSVLEITDENLESLVRTVRTALT